MSSLGLSGYCTLGTQNTSIPHLVIPTSTQLDDSTPVPTPNSDLLHLYFDLFEGTTSDTSSSVVHSLELEMDFLQFQEVPQSPRPEKQTTKAFDWNSEYQKLLAQPSTQEEIISLLEKFKSHASALARQIIEMTPEQRNKISLSNKGIAGGEKFLLEGIFFKYARDDKGIYGGDRFAHKVANHELRAITQLATMQIPDLHLPLACTIDFGGHRMLAISELDIGASTLVYGSCDGGKNFKFAENDQQVQTLVQNISKALHIAPHTFMGKTIYTSVDVEIHRLNNKLYLIDTARLWPPLRYGERKHSAAIFYDLIRPELAINSPVALNPDSFSGFAKDDPMKGTHEHLVKTVGGIMLEKGIENVAQEISQNFDQSQGVEEISRIFHKHGVNMRHSMKVITAMKMDSKNEFVVLEAFSRVLKTLIKGVWRRIPPTKHYEEKLKDALWDILSKMYMGCSQGYFKATFAQLKSHFGIPVTDAPNFIVFLQNHWSHIFQRLQQLLAFDVLKEDTKFTELLFSSQLFRQHVVLTPRINSYI